MATITLKSIPDKLYDDLKQEAKNNHRSLNGEILFALQLYLMQKKKRRDPEEVIKRAREIRSHFKGMLTSEDIDKAINEGRE